MSELNRSQCHGLDLDRHLVLDAGAGTGKTTVMSVRYIEHILCEDQRASRLLPQGPREVRHGQGALRVPARQRQDLEEWQGLLPPECVAITFTVKAAAELKERIRSLLSDLSSTIDPEGKRTLDPRLRREGFVEQLLSLLETAPIGTIDSFLARLVSPHMALVSEVSISDTMSDEERPLLDGSAISLLWSIQSVFDGLDAGLTGDVEQMIQSRDRMSLVMGGRASAEKVIKGLISQSLFVEEAEKAWRERESGDVISATRNLLLSMAPGLDELVEAIHTSTSDWLDVVRSQSGPLGVAAGLAEPTRLRAIDELCSNLPEDGWERLLWLHHTVMSIGSMARFMDDSTSVLPRAHPPKGSAANGWKAGLEAWGKVPKADRDDVKQEAQNHADDLNALLSCRRGKSLRIVARAAALFDDEALPNPAPVGSRMNPRVLDELPTDAPADSPRTSPSMQIQLVEDMFNVLRAMNMIRSQMKRRSGIHDHSDMQRLAEDLLLARCPDVCRTWYPREMVDALDSMSDEPWLDSHVERALTSSDVDERALADLTMRHELLKRMRRRFRAFIIDEFQDTNPQQWRLLARLWGRRHLEQGEPSPPISDWDPTICLVGDVKQSIYRFRQAQVSVMRDAISSVRLMNRDEAGDDRIADLRPHDCSRDTRPRQKGESSTFVRADQYSPISGGEEYSWWRFDLEDDDSIARAESVSARAEGHIDLSRNHRTQGGLLRFINGACTDIFSSRHMDMEGDWYASPQELAVHHQGRGDLEWLMPMKVGESDPAASLETWLDPFSIPRSAGPQLENEMIAQRLHCLINGLGTQISSRNGESSPVWVQLPILEKVSPEDIMILLPTRTHIDDLMKRLEAWGVPATADKLGPLLHRPSIQPLKTLLGLLGDPTRRDLAVSLARSVILGWDDARMTEVFAEAIDGDLLDRMSVHAADGTEASLITRWKEKSQSGDFLSALDEVVDHSDLLLAFPDPSQRNEIEMFLDMVRGLAQNLGGDATRVHAHIEELAALGHQGPLSRAASSGGGVRVMTIHAAKGLQAEVVVIAGLFNAGLRSVSNTTRNHLIVTPELIAGRLRPWRSSVPGEDGLWHLAHALLRSQSEAEVRRLLYVAMTRVKQTLILVGTPGEATVPETGRFRVRMRPGTYSSMGSMLLDGLRAAAHRNSHQHSPWSVEGDDGLDELGSGSPERTIVLDPGSLRLDDGTGIDETPRLTLYHHPDCFLTRGDGPQALLPRIRMHHSAIETSVSPEESAPLIRRRRLRFAPSSVDVAASCLRRHWLEVHGGWPSEPLLSQKRTDSGDGLPDSATLGTLFHRLVEVGLGNPATVIDGTPALPGDWQHRSGGSLDDSQVIDLVLNEYHDGRWDREETADRLNCLSTLLMDGELGRACSGGQLDGWHIEGLRTELPFDLGLTTARDMPLEDWTPSGPVESVRVESVITSLTGRIDLVLALGKEDGQAALQVIDLKTRGCGPSFNHEDPDSGHPLQHETGPAVDAAEAALLEEHRMQLALYTLALQSQERLKGSRARQVLPPAILSAASGRLIHRSDDDAMKDRTDLLTLLESMSRLSLQGAEGVDVSRLSGERASVCSHCPHYSGLIRTCAPEGEELGHIPVE